MPQVVCARMLADELERLMGFLKRVADQARRRVIEGEKVAAGEKVASVLVCHTDIIEKGTGRQFAGASRLWLVANRDWCSIA